MADPIDFYFDFSSPYGYFAAEKIDALAAQHGRGVNWRPILLGAVFKVNGQQPLANIPLKGDYAAHDMLRCARWFALPFKIPGKFLIGSIAPCRAFYWLHDQDAALAKKFALAIYRAGCHAQRRRRFGHRQGRARHGTERWRGEGSRPA